MMRFDGCTIRHVCGVEDWPRCGVVIEARLEQQVKVEQVAHVLLNGPAATGRRRGQRACVEPLRALARASWGAAHSLDELGGGFCGQAKLELAVEPLDA